MGKNWYKIGSVFALALISYSTLQTNAGSSQAVAGGVKDDCPEMIAPMAADTGTDDAEDETNLVNDDCDVTSPSVMSISHSGTDGSTVGVCGPETITITLSEPSTDFVAGDVSVSVGALTGWIATSSTVYTAVFTPPANSTGSATISVAASAFTDAAENFNLAFTSDAIAFDTISPTVAVTQSPSGSLGIGQTAIVTFTLSEPSSDFVAGDVSVSVGALTGWNSTSSTVYTAVFTPPANSTGSATISIAVGAFTDSCNSSKQNVNTGEQFDFIEIAYDTQVVPEPTPTTIPTPTPIEPALLASPTPTTTITPAPPIALPTRGAALAKTQVTTRVYFGLRSSVLTAEGKQILKAAVQKIPKNKKFEVVVVGMVQDSENVANIEPLSSRRANIVRAYLRTLGIKGGYEVRIGGVVGETHTARRARATITYS
jgi:outer membrane protein OmpA-like peptidoglycan-associated protein